jgi:lipopolysaccharide transport system ATP-binding protein
MTSEVAIRVQNLSKCYQIYDNPSDRLKQFIVPRIKRLFGKPHTAYFREFWALRDISFEVKRGETVGIIGRNGSGKSTLLQTICGTLTPTTGTVQVNGRVAALLELGSGFNPEFTGRENVYLNAAVLGLNKEEVDARFDKITAFADIGEFIEQPVKIYSSGMYVKLAFAVIAHVDADILVIDEALAVGDAVFIQKCMRFIRAFQEHGTLLFVSHDTASVQNLCKSAVWLGKGEVLQVGTSKDVAQAYFQYTMQEVYGDEVKLQKNETQADPMQKQEFEEHPTQMDGVETAVVIYDNLKQAKGWQSGDADIVSVDLTNLDAGVKGVLTGGERVRLVIRAKAHEALQSAIIGFLVRDRLGQDLFGENTCLVDFGKPCFVAQKQEFEAAFVFQFPMLPNGQYALAVSVADGNLNDNTQHNWLHDAMIINVSSNKLRYGLVGIPVESVNLHVINNNLKNPSTDKVSER